MTSIDDTIGALRAAGVTLSPAEEAQMRSVAKQMAKVADAPNKDKAVPETKLTHSLIKESVEAVVRASAPSWVSTRSAPLLWGELARGILSGYVEDVDLTKCKRSSTGSTKKQTPQYATPPAVPVVDPTADKSSFTVTMTGVDALMPCVRFDDYYVVVARTRVTFALEGPLVVARAAERNERGATGWLRTDVHALFRTMHFAPRSGDATVGFEVQTVIPQGTLVVEREFVAPARMHPVTSTAASRPPLCWAVLPPSANLHRLRVELGLSPDMTIRDLPLCRPLVDKAVPARRAFQWRPEFVHLECYTRPLAHMAMALMLWDNNPALRDAIRAGITTFDRWERFLQSGSTSPSLSPATQRRRNRSDNENEDDAQTPRCSTASATATHDPSAHSPPFVLCKMAVSNSAATSVDGMTPLHFSATLGMGGNSIPQYLASILPSPPSAVAGGTEQPLCFPLHHIVEAEPSVVASNIATGALEDEQTYEGPKSPAAPFGVYIQDALESLAQLTPSETKQFLRECERLLGRGASAAAGIHNFEVSRASGDTSEHSPTASAAAAHSTKDFQQKKKAAVTLPGGLQFMLLDCYDPCARGMFHPVLLLARCRKHLADNGVLVVNTHFSSATASGSNRAKAADELRRQLAPFRVAFPGLGNVQLVQYGDYHQTLAFCVNRKDDLTDPLASVAHLRALFRIVSSPRATVVMQVAGPETDEKDDGAAIGMMPLRRPQWHSEHLEVGRLPASVADRSGWLDGCAVRTTRVAVLDDDGTQGSVDLASRTDIVRVWSAQ